MNITDLKTNETLLNDNKDFSNYVAKCGGEEDKDLNGALSFLYYFVINITYIIVMYMWLRGRNLFPIRERSPWLVFSGIFCSFLSFQVIPILFFSAIYGNQSELYPTNFLQKNNQYFELLKVLRAILFALQDFSLGLAVVSFLFAYFFPSCLSTPYISTEGRCPIPGFQDNFWTIYNTTILIIFLICAYLIRNVIQEFSLLRETLIIFTLYLLSLNYYTLAIPFNIEADLFNFCLGPYPLYLLIYDLNPIFVMLVITIYPMRIGAKNHMPLPPTHAVNELSFFLIEPEFFLVFYKFLEHLERNSKSSSKYLREKHGTTYLKFHFDVRMIISQINNMSVPDFESECQIIRKLISNYFPKNQTVWAFPEILTRMVFEREREFSFKELDILVRYCLRCLKVLFRLFKRTNSFRFIKEKMSNLDEINDNLFRYNIIMA